MIIQAILLLGIGAAGLLTLRAGPSATHVAVRRTVAAMMMLLGAVAVLFPSTVTFLANTVGVGRGTDLVLYIAVVAFMLSTIRLFRRIYDLEERHVALVRHVALEVALRDEGTGPVVPANGRGRRAGPT